MLGSDIQRNKDLAIGLKSICLDARRLPAGRDLSIRFWVLLIKAFVDSASFLLLLWGSSVTRVTSAVEVLAAGLRASRDVHAKC